MQYLLTVCFIEYATASMSLLLTRNPEAISVIWYANICAGIYIASTPTKYWGYLIVAALSANVAADYPYSQSLLTTVHFLPGNAVEMFLTAFATKRAILRDKTPSDYPRHYIKWFAAISILPPLAGGLIGATLFHLKGWGPLSQLFFNWWQSTVVGAATVLPLALLLHTQGWRSTLPQLIRPRSLITCALNLGITYAAFVYAPYPYAYLAAALIVTALVISTAELSLSILVCGIVAPQLMGFSEFLADISQDQATSILFYLPLYVTVFTPITLACLLRNREKITDKLQQLSARLSDLYTKTPAVLYTLDEAGCIVSVSDQWLTKMGYQREDVIGRPTTDFLSRKSANFFNDVWFDTFRKAGACYDVALKMRRSNGEYIHTSLSAMWHKNGDETHAMAVLTDLSEERRLTDALQREKDLLEITFRSIGDGVIVTDSNGRIKFINPSATDILQLSSADIISKPFGDVMQFLKEEDNSPLDCPVAQCLQEDNPCEWPEIVKIEIAGEYMFLRNSVATITNSVSDSIGAVVTFQDITEVRANSQRMTYLAQHDNLTNLPNRLLFSEQLNKACHGSAKIERHAILFLDLDNFKSLNDSLGHDAGDELLKRVATTLKQCLRETDTICRFGGDEFVVLAKDIEDSEHALVIASKIAQRINALNNELHNKVTVTTSVGIAIYPNNGKQAEELIKRADAAMYEAKNRGKNQVCFFHDSMETQTLFKQEILNALTGYMEQRAMLFYYQPIVETESGEICGAEVLTRWPDKSRLVTPDVFIPMAEEKGLIYELTMQVLSSSIQQLTQWQERISPSFKLSVNISSMVLLKPSFVADVLKLLWNAPIEPSQLIFELTESVLIDNPDEAMKTLERIHSLGIAIAIDDFGTGYSSLRYLKELPIDIVKIDRSFVVDAHNEESLPFLELVMGLVKRLGLIAVAEGVEHNAQWQYLKAIECDRFQGFLISKAIPADEFEHVFLNEEVVSIHSETQKNSH